MANQQSNGSYLKLDSLYDLINSILSKIEVQDPSIRNDLQFIGYYHIIAKEQSTDQLKSEVDAYDSSQKWYSKLARGIGIKKAPPRIRAFRQELSERLTTCNLD
ncbi:MAG: hypothetical protein Q8N99_02220 [Nanoarchaeota archaeon]|nr:hypothetical protein [Nanoarchaeota archaeon]